MPSWLISLLTSLGGVLVGGLVSALTSYFLNNRANKQQLARDKVAYDQQRQRDEQAYEQQKEREQFAYKRSLQDARSERLRSAYKIILNAAKEYMSVLEQRGSVRASETLETRDKRLNESLNKALTGVNEAMVEITLEDVGSDVRMLFSKLRLSFTDYILTQDTNTQVRDTFSQEELDKNKKAVIKQAEELKTIMQQHLKEPVS